MKKLLVSVLALCAFTAVACGDNARLGTSGPTSPVKMFGVSADPSVVDGGGQNAMVGSIAQLTTTGLKAWSKFGANDTDWQPFPMPGLSFVGLRTAIVDLTTTSTPAFLQTLPGGYFLIPTTVDVEATTGTGTVSTSPTIKCGNNAGVTNIAGATTPSTANVQAAITAGPPAVFILTPAIGASAATLVDFGTAQPTCSVTAGATGTGGFTLSGRIVVGGVLVPST